MQKIECFFTPIEMSTDTLNPIMTTDTIELPCFTTPYTLHYGSAAKYEDHSKCGSYFIERPSADESENQNNKKHVITSVKYQPDSVYNMTDGHAGKSWKIDVYNAETETFSTYAIRNWSDLTYHYAMNKQLEFVDRTKLVRR